MVQLIMLYILARYNYVFLDGVTVLNAFLSFIATKAEHWKLVVRSDEMIALFYHTFNCCVHILLNITNVQTGQIIIAYATTAQRMALPIGR